MLKLTKKSQNISKLFFLFLFIILILQSVYSEQKINQNDSSNDINVSPDCAAHTVFSYSYKDTSESYLAVFNSHNNKLTNFYFQNSNLYLFDFSKDSFYDFRKSNKHFYMSSSFFPINIYENKLDLSFLPKNKLKFNLLSKQSMITLFQFGSGGDYGFDENEHYHYGLYIQNNFTDLFTTNIQIDTEKDNEIERDSDLIHISLKSDFLNSETIILNFSNKINRHKFKNNIYKTSFSYKMFEPILKYQVQEIDTIRIESFHSRIDYNKNTFGIGSQYTNYNFSFISKNDNKWMFESYFRQKINEINFSFYSFFSYSNLLKENFSFSQQAAYKKISITAEYKHRQNNYKAYYEKSDSIFTNLFQSEVSSLVVPFTNTQLFNSINYNNGKYQNKFFDNLSINSEIRYSAQHFFILSGINYNFVHNDDYPYFRFYSQINCFSSFFQNDLYIVSQLQYGSTLKDVNSLRKNEHKLNFSLKLQIIKFQINWKWQKMFRPDKSFEFGINWVFFN